MSRDDRLHRADESFAFVIAKGSDFVFPRVELRQYRRVLGSGEPPLQRRRFLRGRRYGRLHVFRPAAIQRLVADEERAAEEMGAQRDVAVMAVNAKVVDVGEWIVLGIESRAGDAVEEVLDVRRYRHEAERAEDFA